MNRKEVKPMKHNEEHSQRLDYYAGLRLDDRGRLREIENLLDSALTHSFETRFGLLRLLLSRKHRRAIQSDIYAAIYVADSNIYGA